jgi:hypothetical protein
VTNTPVRAAIDRLPRFLRRMVSLPKIEANQAWKSVTCPSRNDYMTGGMSRQGHIKQLKATESNCHGHIKQHKAMSFCNAAKPRKWGSLFALQKRTFTQQYGLVERTVE